MPLTNTKHQKKLLLKAFALSPIVLALFPAYGEEAKPKKVEKSDIEVIDVTGFRGSINRAMNNKRLSQNVVDGISAEDIGKSSDQNIAEALQRITGVSINRADGEGTTVSVRGSSADLNNISLNGVVLTSSGADQGVDLSQFSADMLAAIEVVKTPSADHDEGSLGATVLLKSFKPLNAKTNRRSVELQYRNNTFADSDGGPDRKINVSLSEKFLDDSFGVSIVATSETQTLRNDTYDSTWIKPINVKNGATLASSVLDENGVFDPTATPVIVTEWDYDGDGVAEQGIRGHANRQNQYRYINTTRDRDTLSATFQFVPNDRTDIQFDATYSKQSTGRDTNYITNITETKADEPENIIWDPITYDFLKLVNTSSTKSEKQVIRLQRDITEIENVNKVMGLQVEHSLTDDILLSFRAGYSNSARETANDLRSSFNASLQRGNGFVNGFDCTTAESSLCLQVLSDGFADDASNFAFQTFEMRDTDIDDTSKSLYVDLDWDVDFGLISQIEAGIKWNNREKVNSTQSSQFGNRDADKLIEKVTLDTFGGLSQSPSDWGKELGIPADHLTDGFVISNPQLVLDGLNELGFVPVIKPNLAGNRTIEQEFKAIYVKANFYGFDEKLTGDIGFRYVETDVNAIGSSGFEYEEAEFTKSEDNIAFYGSEAAALAALGQDTVNTKPPGLVSVATHSYDNFLPSLNINYALADDMILRFAASDTMARPQIDQLRPNFTVKEVQFQSFSRGQLGSTQLNPFKSRNLDLSFEWYFDDSSMFSATLFNKKFSDFTESVQTLYHYQDVRSEFYNPDGSVKTADEIDYVVDADVVLLPYSENIANQPVNCMPNRENNMAVTEGAEGCDVLEITSQRNGQGGYIRGAEVTFQHAFTYLPGAFSGLGILTNYTYADSQVDAEETFASDGTVTSSFPESPFEQTSEHTFNFTGYWEYEGKLIRLAYNNRSDYLFDRTGRDGYAHWVEGNDSLDLSASWKINESLSMNFSAVNLTDTVTRLYASNTSDSRLPVETLDLGNAPSQRTMSLSNVGTTYRLGLKYSF